MAFTIEPGIYVREAALENLPPTPENKAFIEKIKPRSRSTRTWACDSRIRSC